MYDFANILFGGPCNARCPFCIGRQIDPRLTTDNLDEFPPRNLDRFVEMIREHGIRQVALTGTTTDPQLYRHEARLLEHLRRALPAGAQISLHTNGRLALKKLDTLNLYDKACISFPTFNPVTYQKMMGVQPLPDLGKIMQRARLPIKVSCVVNERNADETPDFLARCHAMGVRRLVFRKLYGDTREWNVTAGLARRGDYRGNPVYDYDGVQVTTWDFEQSESSCINLFSTGVIGTSYLLAQTEVSGDT